MMSIADGRTAAFIQSWECLEAARVVANTEIERYRAMGDDVLPAPPPHYWALIAEADVYARLANVDAGVGMPAGEFLIKKQEREDEQREADIAHLMTPDERISCTCDFDKSQCSVHGGGEDEEDDDDAGD
jgi:hypothetical protein